MTDVPAGGQQKLQTPLKQQVSPLFQTSPQKLEESKATSASEAPRDQTAVQTAVQTNGDSSNSESGQKPPTQQQAPQAQEQQPQLKLEPKDKELSQSLAQPLM